MTSRAAIAAVRRRTPEGLVGDQDLVAVEAPLAVSVVTNRSRAALGVFMRTPGDDADLLRGLLFAEGAVRAASDVAAIDVSLARVDETGTPDAAVVRLADHVAWDAAAGARGVLATSACGLCGRLATLTVDTGRACRPGTPPLSADLIQSLPEQLRAGQTVFGETGGLHAAALFDTAGRQLCLREDVGRHNAVDKVVGAALGNGDLEAGSLLLGVSGRVAFEIVQKAAMAGVAAIVAVGAPSSLAVEAARATRLTLVGFARDGRFNVYADAGRIR